MTSVDYVLPSRWGVYRSQQTSVRGQQGWHSAQQMSVDIQQRLRMAKSPPTWHCISPGTYYQCQEKGEGETSEMMGEKIVREGERCQIQKWSLFENKKAQTLTYILFLTPRGFWSLTSAVPTTSLCWYLSWVLSRYLRGFGGKDIACFGLPMGVSLASHHGNWRYCDCSCCA